MKHRRAAWIASFLLAGALGGIIVASCSSPAGMRRGMYGAPAKSGFAQESADDRNAIPGALPSADEELWVICKPRDVAPQTHDDTPGTGAMLATPPAGKKVPLPLRHTDVRADVAGYIASVNVQQQYENPFDSKIEAEYVLPLPENAAVNEFVMTVGERKIRGIIREREEAEKIYHEARNQGYVASLLTQERPNIFTQKVANIEPGKRIDVDITYFHTLAYVDGWFEFVFPMVVGPRFNPPGTTDGVGAVACGNQGASGQKTEVQYLKPGERSGHEISLAVNVDAGVGIEEIACRSHKAIIDRAESNKATIRLDEADAIPNKDFVLRWRVAGDEVKSALLAHQDERGGYFTLMLVPPAELRDLPRRPMEMIFVLDCSGSMDGRPLAQAKAAIDHALRQLTPTDTFQLINFSNAARQLGQRPLAATPENVRRGLRYLAKLDSEGGTMMIEGIKAALDFPHDSEQFRVVAFLTDGDIGNEPEILAEIKRGLGESRIFSFGVGSSPNRFLMDRMAKFGNGAVAYLGSNDSGKDVMDAFFQRACRAALTDISIDWGGLTVTDVYPSENGRLPDLFVGRPLMLAGRFDPSSVQGPVTVTLRGRTAQAGASVVRRVAYSGDADRFEMPMTADFADSGAHPALAAIWARHKIAELSDRACYAPEHEVNGEIRQVALEYSLMSQFTAFIAVDSLTRTAGDHGTTVAVPVPTPEGVRYETTVGEKDEQER